MKKTRQTRSLKFAIIQDGVNDLDKNNDLLCWLRTNEAYFQKQFTGLFSSLHFSSMSAAWPRSWFCITNFTLSGIQFGSTKKIKEAIKRATLMRSVSIHDIFSNLT